MSKRKRLSSKNFLNKVTNKEREQKYEAPCMNQESYDNTNDRSDKIDSEEDSMLDNSCEPLSEENSDTNDDDRESDSSANVDQTSEEDLNQNSEDENFNFEDLDLDSEVPVEKNPVIEKILSKEQSTLKPGMVYLSVIPPSMNVVQLKSYMNKIGKVNRIFLRPKRVAQKQKKKCLYKDGWVEFEDKSCAKTVAKSLNGNQVGGKKHFRDREFIWCIRYLPKFKWVYLKVLNQQKKEEFRRKMAKTVKEVTKVTDEYAQEVDEVRQSKKKKTDKSAAEILAASVFSKE